MRSIGGAWFGTRPHRVRYSPATNRHAVDFRIISQIFNTETIAVGSAIREIKRLRRRYGPDGWRKMKGVASLRLEDGTGRLTQLHWYEAHSIGRYEFKIKGYLG